MKDSIARVLAKYRRAFAEFTIGQKVVAIVGTGALLLGGFMVYSWASKPTYAPLFSGLSSSDASAIVTQLDSSGVPYQLGDGGTTVLVPQDQVYKTRIDLSGKGLPATSSGAPGYSLLDNLGLSTSQFQEQTDFKRAMEGELDNTIEAIDGVTTAVVHLALPQQQAFADTQQPATASVLVATQPGTSLDAEQVQAVVHLVASSIDGLKPENVTVADSTGRVLSSPDGVGGADATTRDQQQQALQTELQNRLQAMLDRVVGPGNSTVQVTAALNFDKSVSQSTTYQANPNLPPLSASSSKETYKGPAGTAGVGGVVGPDGQMDPSLAGSTSSSSKYDKTQKTSDNAVDTVVQRLETTPGAINSLHVGIALDASTTSSYSASAVRKLVSSTIGIDPKRGDTVQVASMPFNRSTEQAAAQQIAAAQAADAASARSHWIRQSILGGLVALALLAAWIAGRRRNKARREATTYVVEQLRQETVARAALEPPPAALALEEAEVSEDDELRRELESLIERQPEDVAALLRGWLTERA